MNRTVFNAILDLLNEAKVPYRHLQHQPTTTSEESANVRGESTRIGGKALLVKAGKSDPPRFVLFVISAALRLDSVKSRKALKVKRTRFATLEELLEITGLVPGSVPPFGHPILPNNIELYLDQSILQNQRIAFNAGSLTDSIIMDIQDYQKIAHIKQIVNVSR